MPFSLLGGQVLRRGAFQISWANTPRLRWLPDIYGRGRGLRLDLKANIASRVRQEGVGLGAVSIKGPVTVR